jgi:hypothetical protein
MVLNDTTTQKGLIQDCETLTGLGNKAISGSTNNRLEFTRLMNIRYRMADTEIWKATGEWDFDDSNQTTLPIGITKLTNGQPDYSIPSTARKIMGIEVKDINGTWLPVSPMDRSQLKGLAMSEYADTDGIPREYDMVGNSIYFKPAPSSSVMATTGALKIYASRDIVAFSTTVTATTSAVQPGFDNHFHRYISLGASYDWCLSKGLAKTPVLKQQIDEMAFNMHEHYGSRHTDFGTRINVRDMTSL